ncbi:MAG: DUF1501 domain-containing protein [Rhodothermaceae bacterium]|nr:DUF1501 domain-containing protein [Rhodothermaceae bacterium]
MSFIHEESQTTHTSPSADDAMRMNRRHFFGRMSLGIGGLALGNILQLDDGIDDPVRTGILKQLHHAPKAKRIIYLFQSGGPSQLDLFDYKPLLNERNGEDLPDSIRQGQRLTGMTAGQQSFPLAGAQFNFKQYGQSGTWFSDVLPYTSKLADKLCVIRSMYTEAINHDPAITFFQSGSQQPGRPSMGSWLSYGLGSENMNLPEFCVLLSKGSGRSNAQPLFARLWGSGFLPSLHEGAQFRSGKDPVLYLSNPDGLSRHHRREALDYFSKIQHHRYNQDQDPELLNRIAQYEMAFRMQTSVPEVMDLSAEPDYIFDLYGEEARQPGSYAANCLLARRLVEQGVRFVQLYHQGWDQHDNLPNQLRGQCKDTDQASAALILDLEQRGLLEDTLVIWGGEFGRTNYSQGELTATTYGRDHHPRCFSLWMAGGGARPGITYGETDDFGYNITKDPVHVHDFHATIMHLLGIDHEQLTFRHQGRRFRLTDVHGKVISPLLA